MNRKGTSRTGESKNCSRYYNRENGPYTQGSLLHRSLSDDHLLVLYIVPYF